MFCFTKKIRTQIRIDPNSNGSGWSAEPDNLWWEMTNYWGYWWISDVSVYLAIVYYLNPRIMERQQLKSFEPVRMKVSLLSSNETKKFKKNKNLNEQILQNKNNYSIPNMSNDITDLSDKTSKFENMKESV